MSAGLDRNCAPLERAVRRRIILLLDYFLSKVWGWGPDEEQLFATTQQRRLRVRTQQMTAPEADFLANLCLTLPDGLLPT